MVNCADFRNCSDAVDPLDSLVHRLLVKTEDVNNSLLNAVDLLFGDGDGSAGLAPSLCFSIPVRNQVSGSINAS